MGGVGGLNPCPFVVGGGPSEMELTFNELRKAVGGDSAYGPSGDVDELWLLCKAEAISASLLTMERALLQAFPAFATDFLEVYEQLLKVARADTEDGRRAAVTAAFVLQLAADIPHMRQELQRIDPAFDIDTVAFAQATIVYFGKQFGPHPGASGAPYGSGQSSGVNASAWPNYASDFVLHVRYTLAAGQTKPTNEILAKTRRYLNEVLPAWVDFTLYTGVGFLLDGGPGGDSLLDLTAFG